MTSITEPKLFKATISISDGMRYYSDRTEVYVIALSFKGAEAAIWASNKVPWARDYGRQIDTLELINKHVIVRCIDE